MPETILVVDDNDHAVRIAATYLRAKGYDVATASDGASALKQAMECLPACIVLDVMMPGMSGIEVLQRLRSEPATSRIPVILATAKVQDEDVLAGYKEGADYYITKPFTPQELLYGVRLVLGERAPDAARSPAE